MNTPDKFQQDCSSRSWDIVVTNKICPDERTNERGGRTAGKHNAFIDTVGWRRHSKTNKNNQYMNN